MVYSTEIAKSIKHNKR